MLPILLNARYKHSLICFITGLIVSTSLNAQLQANFRADKTGGCTPLTVNFTNTSIGNITGATYRWDFGNGNISTLPNPAAIFIQEQVYTVTLTVTQGTQTSTRTMQIEVYKKPTADFTASIVKGCSPVDVRFTATAQPGSGYVSSYYWDYGDGYTGQTPSVSINHIYNNVQPATVSLTVKNNYGCHASIVKNDLITVLPSISADFEADKQFLCNVSDPIQFTNKSKAQVPLTYLWDFGDGQTTTTENPAYSFNKKGAYTVKLTATSADGCTVTKTQSNSINVANFSTDVQVPALICRDAYTKITATCSPNPTSFDWEFDGTQYNNYWSKEFSTTFYTAGTHNMKFTAHYGACQQQVTRSFTVNDPPKLNGFVIDLKDICGPPARVELKDTSSDAVAWEWDFDTYINYMGSVDAATKVANHTYNSSIGTYIGLRTYNAAGCSKAVYNSIEVREPSAVIVCTTPQYLYGDISACGPITLSFKARPSSTNITNYKWVFDNTVILTDPEPTHTFTSSGSHSVRLEFVTDKGCKGTAYFSQTINIGETYRGSFTSLTGTSICGNKIVLEGKSNAPSSSFVDQAWYINGALVGRNLNDIFIYQFPNLGTYTIRLITNNNGCADTVTKVDYVTVLGPVPFINNIVNSCSVRDEVTFGQLSGNAEKWQWDFGDGQTSTFNTDVPQIKHKYSATGKYEVKLTVTKGQCSVTDSKFAYVYLKPSPVLSAPKMQVCPNDAFDFTLTNLPRTPYDAFGVDFYFNRIEYSDGTSFNGTNNARYDVVNQDQHNGKLSNFEVGKTGLRMILRESFQGCLDTTNYIPLVVNSSKAGFRILNNNVCYNTPIQFEDTSKVNTGNSIVKWEWLWGDGQTVSNQQGGTVNHTYTGPGNYYVTLKVTDAAGCVLSSSQTSTYAKVNGPKAAFTASNTVIPFNTTVYFYNNTNDYSNYRATYTWDFGDGGQSTLNSPQHTFTTPGKYPVKLTATDPVTGCSSEYSITITVNSWLSYTRTLIGQSNCLPMLVNFSVPFSNIDSIRWNFGDGQTAGNMRNTTHVYDKPGKYYIILTAKDPSGQILRYIDSINISTPAITASPIGSLEGCPGATINWNLTSLHAKGFTWDYGDGTTAQVQNNNVSHVYAQAGTFSPVLLVSDSNGCMQNAGIADKVVIHPNPVIAVDPANGIACLSKPFQLSASGANTYTWSPATGLNDAQSSAPLATPPQTTTYHVEGVDGYGCSGSIDYTLTVKHPFNIQVSPPAEICEGKTIELKATGADLYTWINTTDGLGNTNAGITTATPRQTTEYTVVGADKYNCFTDTASVVITVNPLPTVEAGPDVELKPGEDVQLSPVVSSNVTRWRWTPGTYLNCTNCSSPVCRPEADTRYTIKVATQKGCEAEDEILVKIACGEQYVRIPNAFTPNGDGRNDVFGVKGISRVDYMAIYNRFGNKMFERRNFVPADASSKWDGTFNGIPQPTESYVYVIQVHCPTGEAFVKKGTVTLVR